MTQDEIIEMANQAELCQCIWIDDEGPEIASLIVFAKLVAAKEREKTLQLWMLLDDIDTADDIAKADDAVYRSLCRQTHAKRWSVLTGDEVDVAIRARGEA